ncbi:pseudouridine synthase [Ruminococcaceae bacterium OttesenSCG-928-A16]|nr:pseudouridine synthase [Ruminococcaceae bacterium OttesenSCG-928-A16]
MIKKAFQLKQAEDARNQTFYHGEKESVRINKYLTAAGFCSRRGADALVQENRVTIDNEPATMGAQVLPGQVVMVDGKEIKSEQKHVYIALNKPIGITCTVEPDVEGNIADFMDFPTRIFPIGRLDKDSSGLILLTSDGDVVNKILRAENNHEKEYIVKVNQEITPAFIQKMEAGVEITNMRTRTRQTTKKCKVTQMDPRTFKIVLTQGLNRQIRRMCTELGYRAISLHRVRIMNISLNGLKTGQWRYVTQAELEQLNKSV